MSSDLDVSPLLGPLLLVIFHQRVIAPADEWRTAVADALAAGYIHDPVPPSWLAALSVLYRR